MADRQIPTTHRALLPSGPLLLVGLIVLAAGAKSIIADTMDPDLFWHLRVADRLVHEGIHPLVDNLSFASIRHPWTPYSWLAELGMRAIWNFGGYRLAVATAAGVIAMLFALLAKACREMQWISNNAEPQHPDGIAIALATAFAAIVSLWYLSFRPVTFAFMLLALCTWLLLRNRRLQERSSAVWGVVPLTALLVNIHLFALMVPITVGALMAGAMWEGWRWYAHPPSIAVGKESDRPIRSQGIELRRRFQRYAVLLNLTLLACLLTPMLPGAVRTAIHYQSHNPVLSAPVISETQPFWHGTAGQISIVLVIALICCVLWNHRRLRAGEILWLTLGTVLLLKMGRLAPLFVLIGAPVLAATLPRFNGRVLTRWPVVAALAIVFMMGVWRVGCAFPSSHISLDWWLNRNGPDVPGGYPTAAATYIERNVRPITGRLINEFPWGGYLAWRLGDRFQILIDGRTQLYSAVVWRATYLGSDAERQQFLAATHADAAVIPVRNSVFRSALLDLGWVSKYRDAQAEVLVPPATSSGHTARYVPARDNGA